MKRIVVAEFYNKYLKGEINYLASMPDVEIIYTKFKDEQLAKERVKYMPENYDTKQEKIKVLIADDDTKICNNIIEVLNKCEDIDVVGIANTDSEEIRKIEAMKPDIVISDLMRIDKYTGWDIIKDYAQKDTSPMFIIISSGCPTSMMIESKNVESYILKSFFFNYDILVEEIRRIKKEMK